MKFVGVRFPLLLDPLERRSTVMKSLIARLYCNFVLMFLFHQIPRLVYVIFWLIQQSPLANFYEKKTNKHFPTLRQQITSKMIYLDLERMLVQRHDLPLDAAQRWESRLTVANGWMDGWLIAQVCVLTTLTKLVVIEWNTKVRSYICIGRNLSENRSWLSRS